MHRTTGRRAGAASSLLVLAVAAATTATASAGDVRGRLRVPSGYGEPARGEAGEARHRHYWEEWNGFLDPAEPGFDPAEELAVVLTGEGEMAPEQPGFAVANGTLRPSTIVERAGATLRIRNRDPMSHQLYAEGHEEFGPTPTSPGLTRQLVVGGAGDWPIRDALYAHVRGHLHVLPDLVARAALQRDGTFIFRDVPPGTYTLKIFHRAELVHEQPDVEVGERELTLDPIALAEGSEGDR